jgi:hypothetical protein
LERLTVKHPYEQIFPSHAPEDQAWKELKTLLEERIAGGLEDEVSKKSVRQILDEELGEDRAS